MEFSCFFLAHITFEAFQRVVFRFSFILPIYAFLLSLKVSIPRYISLFLYFDIAFIFFCYITTILVYLVISCLVSGFALCIFGSTFSWFMVRANFRQRISSATKGRGIRQIKYNVRLLKNENLEKHFQSHIGNTVEHNKNLKLMTNKN